MLALGFNRPRRNPLDLAPETNVINPGVKWSAVLIQNGASSFNQILAKSSKLHEITATLGVIRTTIVSVSILTCPEARNNF